MQEVHVKMHLCNKHFNAVYNSIFNFIQNRGWSLWHIPHSSRFRCFYRNAHANVIHSETSATWLKLSSFNIFLQKSCCLTMPVNKRTIKYKEKCNSKMHYSPMFANVMQRPGSFLKVMTHFDK